MAVSCQEEVVANLVVVKMLQGSVAVGDVALASGLSATDDVQLATFIVVPGHLHPKGRR